MKDGADDASLRELVGLLTTGEREQNFFSLMLFNVGRRGFISLLQR